MDQVWWQLGYAAVLVVGLAFGVAEFQRFSALQAHGPPPAIKVISKAQARVRVAALRRASLHRRLRIIGQPFAGLPPGPASQRSKQKAP